MRRKLERENFTSVLRRRAISLLMLKVPIDIQKAAQTLRGQTEAVSQWYKENLLQANFLGKLLVMY